MAERTPLLPELERYIPYDKSWMIRMGILDMLHGYDDINRTLDEHDQAALGTDLQALNHAIKQWREGSTRIDVGESGTLYRFLQFAAWSQGRDAEFIKHGTLADRPMTHDPSIVHLPLAGLLQLDNGTSQWASAAVLLGNIEALPEPLPFKLKATHEALDHWHAAREAGKSWEVRRDETIAAQTAAYLGWLATGTMVFVPKQAEDYCFARAFGLMTASEGEAKWPSLRLHESDRIAAMEDPSAAIASADHRVVQAVAMHDSLPESAFAHPEAVAKSWPLFWDMHRVALAAISKAPSHLL